MASIHPKNALRDFFEYCIRRDYAFTKRFGIQVQNADNLFLMRIVCIAMIVASLFDTSLNSYFVRTLPGWGPVLFMTILPMLMAWAFISWLGVNKNRALLIWPSNVFT